MGRNIPVKRSGIVVPVTEIIAAPAFPAISAATPAQNPYHVYLSSLGSDESRRTMQGCLDRLAGLLGFPDGESVPWGLLRFEHTAALRAKLMQKTVAAEDGHTVTFSPSSINKHLTALRKVLESAWLLGQMTAEDFHRARSIKSIKGGPRDQVGRALAEQEIAAMLAVCLASSALSGTRDAALIAVLQSTGMRRDEVATARRSNYDPGERTLRITGKGGRTRATHIHEVAAIYLGQWLAATEETIVGPLFCPIDRWGNALNRHLTATSVAMVISKRRRQAGLPRLSPHDFRRTFAGELLDNGVDLVRVQQLMGHGSPETTSGYDRRPARQRQAAVETLSLPRPEDLAKPLN